MFFNKQVNTVIFKPCGFKKNVHFTFVEGTLSVCFACKRNCKTKNQCRTHHAHTRLPIRETFILLFLDQDCFDEHQKLKDMSFVATRIPSQPCKLPFDQLDTSLPVCSECAEKNRSRKYCRMSKKHQYLPWTTTYFYLTAPDETNEHDSKNYLDPAEDPEIGKYFKRRVGINEEGGQSLNDYHSTDRPKAVDSFFKSRAFLARVNTEKNTLDRVDIESHALLSLSLEYGNQHRKSDFCNSNPYPLSTSYVHSPTGFSRTDVRASIQSSLPCNELRPENVPSEQNINFVHSRPAMNLWRSDDSISNNFLHSFEQNSNLFHEARMVRGMSQLREQSPDSLQARKYCLYEDLARMTRLENGHLKRKRDLMMLYSHILENDTSNATLR